MNSIENTFLTYSFYKLNASLIWTLLTGLGWLVFT